MKTIKLSGLRAVQLAWLLQLERAGVWLTDYTISKIAHRRAQGYSTRLLGRSLRTGQAGLDEARAGRKKLGV